MYSEKAFKNYIFWLQVKRVFLIILLSIIGAVVGVLIGKFLESTVQISSYTTILVIISTLIFFAISVLITANTGKEVQDGYWKIAVLRKLTVIQKDLEFNNELLSKSRSSSRIMQEDEDDYEEETIEEPPKPQIRPEMSLVKSKKKDRKSKRKLKLRP